MHRLKQRLGRLEAQVLPPFPIPDDLSILRDDDLVAVCRWCDRLHGPAVGEVIESMSDAELAAVVQMGSASAEAFIRERIR